MISVGGHGHAKEKEPPPESINRAEPAFFSLSSVGRVVYSSSKYICSFFVVSVYLPVCLSLVSCASYHIIGMYYYH